MRVFFVLLLVSIGAAEAGLSSRVLEACRRALETPRQETGFFEGLARVVTPLIDAKRDDFSVVSALAGERIINPDVRIQYLGSSEEKGPKAPEPPRGPHVRRVVLQLRTSQEIVVLNSDGEGQWFLRHLGRVYKVELSGEAIFEDVDTWPESSSFRRLRTMNLGESSGTHYRDSAAASSSDRAVVVMPTGYVFVSMVDDPKFGSLGLSWLDPETGLIWSQSLGARTTMDWEAAKKACIDLGGWLPTRPEGEQWVVHVGRTNNGELNTLFPKDSRLFWSSSVHSDRVNHPDFAYDLTGDFSYIYPDFGRNIDHHYAVRCVRSSRLAWGKVHSVIR